MEVSSCITLLTSSFEFSCKIKWELSEECSQVARFVNKNVKPQTTRKTHQVLQNRWHKSTDVVSEEKESKKVKSEVASNTKQNTRNIHEERREIILFNCFFGWKRQIFWVSLANDNLLSKQLWSVGWTACFRIPAFRNLHLDRNLEQGLLLPLLLDDEKGSQDDVCDQVATLDRLRKRTGHIPSESGETR